MAIYQFITDKDMELGMKRYFIDQVTIGATHVLKTVEAAAVSIMKAKLNNRYDLTKVYPSMPEWSSSKAYAIGDYSFKSDKIYKAKIANTNKDPLTNTSEWEENDPRDQFLVVLCVNITLYFLLERVNPRKLSDDIANGYVSALEWLDEVKMGNENPVLPLLEDGASTIPYGSNEKLDHYY